ncbi:MAG: MipA/OmpV family protein, partial [Rhodospirillales bacterium]|nr:MipA/OmpV family protein [Rhodospirillales bacterium]
MLTRILATLMLCALAHGSRAQEVRLPVLEVGVAGGGGYLADYPAASQGRVRGIAAPYLIYRGEVLRSDDRGARLRAALSDDIEFSVSASGSLPVSSSDNDARRGMPDLDLLGEIGPTLRLTLWRGTAGEYPVRLLLDTPLRAVFSTDFSSISFRGVTFSPDLSVEARNVILPNSRLRATLGVTVASDRFMEYFYEVRPQFA